MKSKKAKGNGIEEIISLDFKKVLKKVSSILNGAKIMEYKINYSLELEKHKIIITKLKLPGGRILSEKNYSSYQPGFHNSYLEYVCDPENDHNSLIKRFKEDHKIHSIKWVN